MANNDEEIRYRATLDTDDFVEGQEEIRREVDETNDDMQEGNRNNARSFRNLNSTIKKLVIGGGALILLKKALGKIIELGKESLAVFGKTEMALKGLSKTAEAYGQNTDEALKAAKELTEDGLIPLGDAAKTIKNLISTGFSVSEAMDIAKGFKEIGAFNRVVDDLGQAMVDSSKGIKTNSIELIENIGLTERLSTTMEKANVSIKKGIDLTNSAAQREAFRNSILQQSITFQGNAEEAANSYQGATSQLSTAVEELKNEIGKGLAPMAIKATQSLTKLTKATNNYLKVSREVKELNEGLTDFEFAMKSRIRDNEEFEKWLNLRTKGFITENKLYTDYLKEFSEVTEEIKKEQAKFITFETTLQNNRLAELYSNNEMIAQGWKEQTDAEKKEFEKREKFQQDSYNRQLANRYNFQNELQRNEAVGREERRNREIEEREKQQQILDEYNADIVDRFATTQELQRNETVAREDEARKRLELERKFATASQLLTQKIINGELKSIDDLKEIALKQFQATATGKVLELTTEGITEGVLALSSFARGDAAGGAAHTKASTAAFAGAAKIGIIAGLASAALGGGEDTGGATITEDNDNAVETGRNIEQTQEARQSIVYEIPSDSEIYDALLPRLDEAAQKGYDIRLITKR